MTKSTSAAAFKALPKKRVATIRGQLLELLEESATTGLIFDDLRKLFPATTADGTIRARIIELEAEGLLVRSGDVRKAPTNCEQLVMRHFRFASSPPSTVTAKRVKNPFLAGVVHATKLLVAAGNYEDGRAALLSEIRKVAKLPASAAET